MTYNPEDEIEASRAPLMDHLIELRQRLIVSVVALVICFFLCFAFAQQIYMVLLQPFEMAGRLLAAQKAIGANHGPFDLLLAMTGYIPVPEATSDLKLIYTAPLEFFFTKMKLAGFGALVLSFPVIAWQLYRFIAPGLYRREKMAFAPFLVAAPILFSLGAALVYFIILPMVLWFSLSQQILGQGGVTVELLPKVADYLSLVMTLLLAFGLCFQLPIVVTLLGMARIVNAKLLSEGRRYAILGIVIVAAIVTPPDPISQLMLAIPIALLYELSIWCVRLIEMRRKDEDLDETGTDAVPY